jgi:hypothetical protein
VTVRQESAGYLDAIFVSIRAFSQELEASRKWLGRAEQTENQAWRLSFLRAARASFERTPGRLAAILEHLTALGSMDTLPAPLDRIRDNVATMRAEVAAQGERLRTLEANEARAAAPIGQA